MNRRLLRGEALRRPGRSQQSWQVGQGGNRVIGRVAEALGVAPQQTRHLRRQDRVHGHAGTTAEPNPNGLKSETLSADDIETVGRYEEHFVALDAEGFLNERITSRMLFELSRSVNADGSVKEDVEAGILNQRCEHGGAAIRQNGEIATSCAF